MSSGFHNVILDISFFVRCGAAVGKEEILIRYYFQRGLSYSSILLLLSKYHKVEMSWPTLHNRLRNNGLRRRGASVNDWDIHEAINQELDWSLWMRGYRILFCV